MSLGDAQRLFCGNSSAFLIGMIQSNMYDRPGSPGRNGALWDVDSTNCLGSWTLDVLSKRLTMSPSLAEAAAIGSGATTPSFRAFVHPDDIESFEQALSNLAKSGAVVEVDHRLSESFGMREMARSYLLATGEQPDPSQIVGVLFKGLDIKSGRERADAKSIVNERPDLGADAGERKLIREMARALPESIYVSDIEEKIFSYRNRDFFGELGYPAGVRELGLLSVRDIVYGNDLALYEEHQRRIRQDRKGETIETTCRMQSADGEWRWFHLRNVVFRRDPTGKPLETIGTIQDVTEQMSREMQLRETVRQLRAAEIKLRERQEQLEDLNHQLAAQATTDGLTGLYNYRAFHEKLAEEVRRARRYDYQISVVLADVDDFKIFNDRFGHPAGDERLRQFAAMLRQDSRESDFVSRTGGEEFGMILINTGACDAGRFAQRLVDRLNREQGTHRLTASFGCAELESEDRSKEDLVRRADDCLYQAKRRGKNQVVVASRDSSATRII